MIEYHLSTSSVKNRLFENKFIWPNLYGPRNKLPLIFFRQLTLLLLYVSESSLSVLHLVSFIYFTPLLPCFLSNGLLSFSFLSLINFFPFPFLSYLSVCSSSLSLYIYIYFLFLPTSHWPYGQTGLTGDQTKMQIVKRVTNWTTKFIQISVISGLLRIMLQIGQ
jgi:hypothetical protein